MPKFVIPQINEEEQPKPEKEKKQNKQKKKESEPFVSTFFGRNVRDELSVSAVQYGNYGAQYDIFRDPSKRIRKDEEKDYVQPVDELTLSTRKDLSEEEIKRPTYLNMDPVYADLYGKDRLESDIIRREPGGEVYVNVSEKMEEEAYHQPSYSEPEHIENVTTSQLVENDYPLDKEPIIAKEEPKEEIRQEQKQEIRQEQKQEIRQETKQKPIRPLVGRKKYIAPPFSFLQRGTIISKNDEDAVQFQIDAINSVFSEFRVDAKVVNYTKGPTVTQFEVQTGLGVKLDAVKSLQTNIQAKTQAKTIRLEVPIPGRTTIGIEIPNANTDTVFFGDLVCNNGFTEDGKPLRVALGIDLFGKPLYFDITKGPHALIGGTTNSGKSVCLHCIINSIIYKDHPDDVKMIIIDPKMLDFSFYEHIPHLAMPIITDPKVAQAALKWCCQEMDDRYALMKPYRVTDISSFNQVSRMTPGAPHIPYLLVIVDEFADLSLTSGSETLEYIQRIVQKGRAAGIHMILATQRPSADIMNGAIKSNTGVRIAFQVKSGTDSAIILDHQGAEKLLGRGDMLFNDSVNEVRAQGAYIDREEIIKITNFLADQGEPEFIADIEEEVKKTERSGATGIADEELVEVARYIVSERNASINKITKVFSMGFNKAQMIMETLEGMGVVSGNLGSRAREVLVTVSELEDILSNMQIV